MAALLSWRGVPRVAARPVAETHSRWRPPRSEHATGIDARIEHWRGLLLDTSRWNRLINCKTGRASRIALAHPDAGRVWATLVAEEGKTWFARGCDLLGDPAGDGIGDRPGPSDSDVEGGDGRWNADRENLDRRPRSPREVQADLITDLTDKPLAARLNRMSLYIRASKPEMDVMILHFAA